MEYHTDVIRFTVMLSFKRGDDTFLVIYVVTSTLTEILTKCGRYTVKVKARAAAMHARVRVGQQHAHTNQNLDVALGHLENTWPSQNLGPLLDLAEPPLCLDAQYGH